VSLIILALILGVVIVFEKAEDEATPRMRNEVLL